MADGPKFAKFVRSVPGCAVQRYGTSEFIGATRKPLTKQQRVEGESAIEWNDAIVPLTVDFCRRYARELAYHLTHEELVEVPREEWDALQAQRDLEAQQASDEAVVEEINNLAAAEADKE
jgi:hypothetical protein